MERFAGIAVAEAYVRHEPDTMAMVYGRATPEEVAANVIALFGGSHPDVTKVAD